MRRLGVLAALTAALALTGVSACGAKNAHDTGPQPGDRVVTHAMGATTVHGQPQRVVVLDTGELDAVLSLGVRPVGAVTPDANQSLPPYLAGKAQGVAMVGTINQPNLERITALHPDLILSSKTRDADKYDQLSRIAPTVFAGTVGPTWKQNFLLDADALGRKPEAERILRDYQDKARTVGQRAGDPSKITLSMVRFLSGGNDIRLYGQGSFVGTILADAGFARPQNQRIDKVFTKVSQEQLGQVDGDIIGYAAYGPASQEREQQIVAGPQWQELNAVRNHKAFAIPDDTWFLGLGPTAANLVLDDLAHYATPASQG